MSFYRSICLGLVGQRIDDLNNVIIVANTRDLKRKRWQRQVRRLAKNLILFYFGISHLFGTIQCVCQY